MLFPMLGDVYLNERDRGIIARMESFYSESITINQSYWGEADTDTRFYCNDQTLWQNLYGNLPANRRRNLAFNRIMRVVNMIDGHQRRNRKSIIMTPKENGDNETADQFTKIIMTLCQQEGILETISDSFHGGLVTGMNLLHVWLDYRNDPISGDIRVNNCSYNSFLIDPYFRKADLSDCNGIWKRSYLTKREAISLMPQFTDEILGLPGNQYGNKDGKFQFMPESYQYGYKNLLAYDEFYYRDFRQQRLLADSKTGEVMEWKGKDEDALKLFLQLHPSVTVLETEIPTVNLAIVIQGKVFYNDRLPTGADNYPFIPVFAYYNPQIPYFENRVQGVVRGLRDSQFLYNRRKIIELDILESQINSGFIYKENALVNPKDVFLSGQGRGLALKEEAQMTDVQQIQSPQIPPTTIELSKMLGEEINQIAGVSEELLGFDNKDTLSGFHSMLKQSASTTTLQILFDHLDRSIKLLGDRMAEIIQINYTPGKIKKILEGQEPQPLFYNKAFGKYHAAVEEGLNTTTQKQMQMAQMLMLREAGVPISNQDLLEASTLQNKKMVIDNMMKEQQAAQQQQQQAQVQMQEMQARTNLAHARAQADQGLAVERTSRVEENRALAMQKLAEANKNDEQALLEKVKIIKEIGHMDLDEIAKLINMANLLKANENNMNINQQNGSAGSR